MYATLALIGLSLIVAAILEPVCWNRDNDEEETQRN